MAEPPEPGVSAPEERILLALWAELLEQPVAGPDADFLRLGGTSLLAMRVSARLRYEHGIQITMPEVLENPTVAELAELMRARRG
jgi:aryl carrier-like protein